MKLSLKLLKMSLGQYKNVLQKVICVAILLLIKTKLHKENVKSSV